jgi:hypothetical protein
MSSVSARAWNEALQYGNRWCSFRTPCDPPEWLKALQLDHLSKRRKVANLILDGLATLPDLFMEGRSAMYDVDGSTRIS